MFGLLRKVIISKVNMECESRHFTLEKAHMCACFVCSMFASFIINEKNRLCCVVLTNELLPSLVLFSPSYMLFFYHHNSALLAVTHHWSLQLFLSVCMWEREREEDNFIWTKYEHVRNTQCRCYRLSIPPPHVTMSHYFWVRPPCSPGNVLFERPPKERPLL